MKTYNVLNETARFEQFVDEIEEIRMEAIVNATEQGCIRQLKTINQKYDDILAKAKRQFEQGCEQYA